MADVPVRALGLVWYHREDYPAILDIMDDAQVLPREWEQWHKSAQRVEREMKAKGHVVVQVVIDPETFPAWCIARGLNVDAKARTRFANEGAMTQVRSTH